MVEIARSKTVAFWCDQIAIYEREFKKWEGRSKKIIKRYKDERNDSENARARFNILWSNIQTLAPALYAKAPVPNVDRRYDSDDEMGVTTARVIERAVTYFVETELFDSVMTQCVLDRLLPGRGLAWVRYVPNFKDATVQGSEEVKEQGSEITDDILEEGSEPEQELYSEDVLVDYVHWLDFGHTWARTWEETRGLWRKVYMTRQEMIDRAFDKAEEIPLDYSEKKNADDGGMNEMGAKKATIYEIWDKTTKQAIWVHKNMEDVLDQRDDPLGLESFFPCPKPIYATLANDNLIPTPDYIQYQDQAKELDELTGRINSITKALKVVGVYDKSAEGLSRILSEGLENTMVPVENWALFGEKGGLKGTVDWFPLEMIISTVVSLYDAREKVKSDLYEITGISDIIRGASDPNETATASNIKGQYATLRLNSQQKDVARFARDLVRIMAEIVCKHFSLDTIKQISGMRLFTAAEKQMIQMKMQQPPQPGQPPIPPPPDEIQELLDQPTWEEVEQLIRNDTLRCFRISIETDSTIKMDQEAEKKSRVELLTAVGGYMQQAAMLPPQLQPLAAELLMFGVRGFKVAREIETTFEVALKKIKQAADAPPPPNPEAQKAQAQAQSDQQKMQMEAQNKQAQLQADAQAKQQDIALTSQVEDKKISADLQKQQVQLAVQKEIEQLKAETSMQIEAMNLHVQSQLKAMDVIGQNAQARQSANQDVEKQAGEQAIKAQDNEKIHAILGGIHQTLAAVTAPKKVIRDENGRIAGVVSG